MQSQDRAHRQNTAASIDDDQPPPQQSVADPGPARALLQQIAVMGCLTPDGVADALLEYPELRDAVLAQVHAHWGMSGVQALVAAEACASTGPASPAGSTTAASAHAASGRQIAERDALNAVITVIAHGPDGMVVSRWRARGRWQGPLPARYHGTHGDGAWTWSDPAGRDTRLHTRPDGTGGTPVEAWAAQHGAASVDVVAESVDASAPDDDASEVHAGTPGPAAIGGDRSAGLDLLAGLDPLAGPDPEEEWIVAEFERELGIDPDRDLEDEAGGHGAPGGDPHGRTGEDAALDGTGPGGPWARAGGDHEGSVTRGAVEGSRLGSALGVKGGSEGGLFAGEGKPGDEGVRGAGAIAGGVIVIPAALKGVVELLLVADAGDVTGMGAALFTQLGRRVAGMSAAALREVVAREARVACERELRATLEKMARTKAWLALSAEERIRAIRIAYWELQRRFFRGFAEAAKVGERSATRALRGAAGARKIASQESLDAARLGAEAAEVEPVAGRLPRNHEFAGGEFPRDQLPPKYRKDGLRFKRTGYPDFEPYALTLPNGKKTVRIELTGSRRADELLANKTAGLEEQPERYTWHHLEDGGTMMLVPSSLHEAVAHSGGGVHFKHRTGIKSYGD